MKHFIPANRTVEIEIYNACKYDGNPGDCRTVKYTGVEAFEVVTGEAAAQIEAESDGSCIDDFHEYLILYLKDGDTSIFRNSYVDMFI